MNKDQIKKLFTDFIKIESVSTEEKRRQQIIKAAEFLRNFLKKLEFKTKILKKKTGHPLVFGEKFLSKQAKTIVIYGHYDVQPEAPIKAWQTPPFQLTLKNNKFFGRGTADNKGSIIQNLVAISDLIKEKKLKNNIIFIFEGEEELGSLNFEKYVLELKNRLSLADVFYITDVGMHRKNQPQIFYGLRGIVYFELEVMIGKKDLHSGVYGNRVYNPINILADLISKIKDIRTGKINVPGFYNQVRKVDQKELMLLKKTIRSEKEEKREAEVFGLTESQSLGSLSSKVVPSFDCHGIISGFTEQGQKTIIPNQARVKFSFRLVEHQDPETIERLVFQFIKKNIVKGVKWQLNCLSKSSPFYTSLDHQEVKRASRILEESFNRKPIFNRSGGSIPAAEILQRLFKKPVILTGFTLPDDNIHAPNENFDEAMFWQGILTLKRLYQ